MREIRTLGSVGVGLPEEGSPSTRIGLPEEGSPSTRMTEIERGDQCWHFRWRSQSDQAPCPVCPTVSPHSAKLYTTHTVPDFPLAGKPVYHTVTNTR